MRVVSFVTAVGLLLFAEAAQAEIQPKYYAEMQVGAPEHLQIDVVDVDVEWCLFSCESRDVEVRAKVVAVERSASGLTAGASIVIKYVHFEPSSGWAGPRPIPVLPRGETVAYLQKAEAGYYEPAAGGYSFDTVRVARSRPGDPIPGTPNGGRTQDGFFVTDDAPSPRACEADADCIGDTTLGANGCCVEPTSLRAFSRKYHAWAGARRSAPMCAGVECPPPPSPDRPADCYFQVSCVDKRCVNACKE